MSAPSLWAADQDRFADLLLGVGVNLRPGQALELTTPPEYLDFARLVTRRAYARGARYVQIRLADPAATRARLLAGRRDDWGYVPELERALARQAAAEGWARIFLEDNENTLTLADLDPEAIELVSVPLREARRELRVACMNDRLPWCVAAVPGAVWARETFARAGRVFAAGPEGDEAAREALWQVLRPIYRLDAPDPAAAWRAWGATLDRRRQHLQNLNLRTLHFRGPGTDLTVGLTERALWVAAESVTPQGQAFWANLPTEEVYTTPDARRTEGRVAFTRPVEVSGTLVRGGWLEFHAGVVTAFGAEDGAAALEAFLEADAGARRLGEVALVGTDSPLFQSGLVFASGLLDENASCHIALGEAYPTALVEGESLPPGSFEAWGVNVSQMHTDFMISGPAVDVDGRNAEGRVIPLLRQGRFVLDA